MKQVGEFLAGSERSPQIRHITTDGIRDFEPALSAQNESVLADTNIS